MIPNDALEQLGYAIASQDGDSNHSGITAISIGDQNMSDDGIVSLCKGLKDVKGGSIQSIDLALKSITHVGAAMIGMTFGPSTKLENLILCRNTMLGDEGLDALCQAAMESSSCPFSILKKLDLSDCNVGSKGLESLVLCLAQSDDDGDNNNNDERNSRLIDLHLNSNHLGPNGCSPIANLISGSSFKFQQSILQSLSMRDCAIGDEGMKIISQSFINTNQRNPLVKIDLSNNQIGSRGMKLFALALKKGRQNMALLTEFNLAENAIGEEGILALVDALMQQEDYDFDENRSLISLDLSNTDCGINGAVSAINCPSISRLRLFNNKLGSKGINAISSYFTGGHPSLNHVDLGGNIADGEAISNLLSCLLVDQNRFEENKLMTLELGGNENNNEALFVKVRNKLPGIDIPLVKETPRD